MECCGYRMQEVESAFMEEGEYGVVGWECQICGRQVDLNGKEVKSDMQSKC